MANLRYWEEICKASAAINIPHQNKNYEKNKTKKNSVIKRINRFSHSSSWDWAKGVCRFEF